MGGNGMIYGVPGHAKRVLKIDPVTQEVSLVGPVLPGKYKWLRGVLAQDGGGDLLEEVDGVSLAEVVLGLLEGLLILGPGRCGHAAKYELKVALNFSWGE